MADRFVTKEGWGANPSKEATEDSHPIGATEGVTLHWEGPHMGAFPHSACAGKVRGIERFHEYGRGWGDVAYNALVCPHGYIFEGRGAGVTSAANGDTASNGSHYAVCYLGGEGDGFTDEGRTGMAAAVAWLRAEGNAGPEVNGHRDHKATACPGGAIYEWLQGHDFNSEGEDDMFTDEDRELLRTVERMTRNKLERANTRAARTNTRLARANTLLRELRDRDAVTPADLDGALDELGAALAEHDGDAA